MKLQYNFKMQNFEFGLRVVGVDCGIVGVWECGSVGVWVCGIVGLWNCGIVGLWVVGEIIYTW